MKRFDVCIRGAGAVGRSLALALARQGLQVALVRDAARAANGSDDIRAYALNTASVALLRELKVWDALPPNAATSVHDMHIEGDDHGVLEFSAWQQRVSELAWIVDAGVLDEALAAAVRFAPHVTEVNEPVEADLQALCEGKHSSAREALGVHFERQPYGHTAIAARLVASEPHRHTARQWFRHPDVLALLPFDTPQPGSSYGLVWSLPEERAHELLALDAPAFEAALAEATGGQAGTLTLHGERASWPLTLARASAWSGPGWVLLGDAAHVVHPLAGQGLNLGLGDVATLAQVIKERESWRTLGDERLLRRYERRRLGPVQAMATVTDGLLQLFAQDHAGLRELRNRGMGLVNHLTPLKRWLTARALGA
jgi:2-polyprenyl-6-methoxyphenol hydroxylase-like FAD-dependent oxidoreductase